MADAPDPNPADEDGIVDSDDTTQADAGMPGGSGAAPGEGSTQPYGTEREGRDD
jgi:hypothetical protein